MRLLPAEIPARLHDLAVSQTAAPPRRCLLPSPYISSGIYGAFFPGAAETGGRFSVSCPVQDGPVKRCTGKRHAALIFVHDIPFALLRAPAGSRIPGDMCICWMPGSAVIRMRAQSARNVLNSQSAAIALSGASFPVRPLSPPSLTAQRRPPSEGSPHPSPARSPECPSLLWPLPSGRIHCPPE